MYAIIRTGGKQAKVQSGDVIDIERVKTEDDKLTFEPLLVVDDDGNAVSDRKALAKASVTAKVLGESAGPKIDIFKYKNKTGYRRRQGHRQKYTRIEVTGIKLPAAAKKKTPAKETEGEEASAEKASAKKDSAKSSAKTSAKTASAKKDSAKSSAKTSAKTASAKKTSAKKTSAKKKDESAASEEE